MINDFADKSILRTVDVFAGCGGLSLGFQNAGFKIVAAYDNWELANTVYRENFGHDAHLFDLSQEKKAADHIKQYRPDVIIGGPPCQDFSIAGKRSELDRANLTITFSKIIASVSPNLAVMENVYSIENSKALPAAIKILKRHGYGITSKVIDASLTGVPQKRKRFFLIAGKNMPDNVFEKALEAKLAKKPMTLFDYFGDKLKIKYYYAHPRNYKRRAVFSIHEPSATIRRVNRPIPKNYVKHPADKSVITPKIRPLTLLERMQIQTFPVEFVLRGSNSQKEHLIANAVPVKLAQYVAERVFECLSTMRQTIQVREATQVAA